MENDMKQKIYRDPVCGKKINRQRAQILIKYKGYGYFLCCPLCQKQFEQDPVRYAKAEYAFKIPIKKKKHGKQAKQERFNVLKSRKSSRKE